MQSHCQAKLYPSMWTLCYAFHRTLTCVKWLTELSVLEMTGNKISPFLRACAM